MIQIVQTPLGANGSLSVSESAGVLSIAVADAAPQYGVSATLGVSVSAVALVQAWAAATTNAGLKAGLTELAAILAALPV